MNSKFASMAMALVLAGSLVEAAVVSSVEGKQRWPWNGKVDIVYNLNSPDSSKNSPVFSVSFAAYDNGADVTMTTISGEGAKGIVLGAGQHVLTWDASTDYNGKLTDKMKFGVYAEDITSQAQYLKVKLADGSISYQSAEPTYADEDKTDYLWLRRVEPGTFTIGSSTNETQRTAAREAQHQVTLTKAFYIGVFEITRGQVNALSAPHGTFDYPTGSNPTYSANEISYNDLRGETLGATWPSKTDYRVDSTSFMGLLRAKTGNGITFDLPTEAQWEFACRGSLGTDGRWNNGDPILNATPDANLDKVGWYASNSDNACHEVGGKTANSLGLYDMHGNAFEWCLDWFVEDITSLTLDPVGPKTGTFRVLRGGGWCDGARYCRSANRICYDASYRSGGIGARVCVQF